MPDVMVQAQFTWANICNRQDDYAAARRHAEASAQLTRAIGDRSGECAALSELGLIAVDRDDCGTALAHVEAILAYQAGGELIPRTDCPMWVGLICVQALQAAGDQRGGCSWSKCPGTAK